MPLLSADTTEALQSGLLSRDALTAELEALRQNVNAATEHRERLQYRVVIRDGWSVNTMFAPTPKICHSAIEQWYLPLAQTWAALKQSVIWE